jgi:MFS family permease
MNTCAILIIRDRNASIKPSQVGFAVYLLKRPEVILLLSYSFMNMLGYMILLYSLSNYAVSIGLSQSQASIITALLNLGTAVGRPAVGFASDRLGRILIAGSLSMFTGLCVFCIWIPATSYGVLIFYALLAGSTIGTFWMVSASMASD